MSDYVGSVAELWNGIRKIDQIAMPILTKRSGTLGSTNRNFGVAWFINGGSQRKTSTKVMDPLPPAMELQTDLPLPGPPGDVAAPGLPGPRGAAPLFRPPGLSIKDVTYFWRFTTGHRLQTVAIVALLLSVAGLQMAPAFAPVALVRLTDGGSVGPRSVYLGLIALLVASLLAIGGQFLAEYLSTRLTESIGRRIKVALFSKIGALPAGQAGSHSIGAMAFRVGGDVQQIRDFLAPGLTQTTGEVFVLLVAFIIMAWFALPYAILCLAAALVIALAAKRSNSRVMGSAIEAQMASEMAMTQYIEGVAGYRDLAASGRFGRAVEEYDRRLARQQRAVISTFFWGSIGSLAPQLLFSILYFGYYFLTASMPGAAGRRARTWRWRSHSCRSSRSSAGRWFNWRSSGRAPRGLRRRLPKFASCSKRGK